MEAETLNFLECVATGKPPLVTPEHARMVMQLYKAADLSVETNQPVALVVKDSPASPPPRPDASRRIPQGDTWLKCTEQRSFPTRCCSRARSTRASRPRARGGGCWCCSA